MVPVDPGRGTTTADLARTE
jgi:hypothetical protein